MFRFRLFFQLMFLRKLHHGAVLVLKGLKVRISFLDKFLTWLDLGCQRWVHFT